MSRISFIGVCFLFTGISTDVKYSDKSQAVHNVTNVLIKLDRSITEMLLEPTLNSSSTLVSYMEMYFSVFDIFRSFLTGKVNKFNVTLNAIRSIGGPRLIRIRLNMDMYKQRFQWNQTTVHFVYTLIQEIDSMWKVVNMIDKDPPTTDKSNEFQTPVQDFSASD